uniref:Uncharacterized protein n=1 Tax=Romanomermis culicivorax TaxID=13658 RepID=A0A915JKH7_ROMCU
MVGGEVAAAAAATIGHELVLFAGSFSPVFFVHGAEFVAAAAHSVISDGCAKKDLKQFEEQRLEKPVNLMFHRTYIWS